VVVSIIIDAGGKILRILPIGPASFNFPASSFNSFNLLATYLSFSVSISILRSGLVLNPSKILLAAIGLSLAVSTSAINLNKRLLA